ncbi:UpxY family transcription antiterminator [uncultured Paludibaculum sp.]|uniref:transcription termination/antitermination protein NusG n=1 Tax=uncultured Paludibaculum sp. TaxID=1765020 RepID=UPI002AAB2420|nr:UpxY family transcription antiterminator [uncultured Paludibaculum sp.]
MDRMGPHAGGSGFLTEQPTSLRQPYAWYALTVRPQHERSVEMALAAKGLTTYLPLFTTLRKWSDRFKKLVVPLFPGYVFCRFDGSSRVQVLRTPGVITIVSTGLTPTPIPDAQVDAVRRMLASGVLVEPWGYLKEGERVRIQEGPMAGIEGILLEVRDAWRLVVSIELFQRSVAVQIHRGSVVPARL